MATAAPDGAVPAVDDALWEIYCSAAVRIDLPGRCVELVGGDRLDPAPGDPGALYVLTAWNPLGRELPEAVNHRAARRLVAALETAGTPWHPALGHAADGSWAEEGLAVALPSRAEATALGRRWEQLAVYEWSPGPATLSVVACFEDRITTMAVSAFDVPPPPP